MSIILKRICGTLGISKSKKYFNVYSILKQSVYSTSKSDNTYLVDEDDNLEQLNNSKSRYTTRTYTCGDLRSKNIGETVTLCGWLEYQRMSKFVVLRDGYGETQVLIKDEDMEIQKLINNLPLESIIEVIGTVLSRPSNMINKKQTTGDIEILVDNLRVLNKAKDNLPFNIREYQKAKESLRMQYRYLDLRFPVIQRNLRLRSEVLMKMREFLVNHSHFVDVETPTLFKATPGGAQEFIVPTRFPGEFYSLVQSPQQFKQMLMAGAIDRYFQIARCYRDEGSRSDRQPEFTQLDIEMSFTNIEGIISLIEELLSYSWPHFLNPLPRKFTRLSYEEALNQYGSDKPDTRFGFELKCCTEMFKQFDKYQSEKDFGASYLVFPNEYSILTKAVSNSMLELSKLYPTVKFVHSKVSSVSDWTNKISKLLTTDLAECFAKKARLQTNCIVFLGFGNKNDVLSLMGKVRLDYVNHLEKSGLNVRKDGMHFLWIVDFPLFEMNQETSELQCSHHPFTAPHPDDMHLLESEPLKVRSLAYDLVLNGNEVGGGSIRIHDPSLQETIFKMLKIEKNTMQHILDMLASGCPPHGGIALGIDRLLAVMLNTTSIRDVIAFPKTFEGRDPVSGAPTKIADQIQKLYNIKSINLHNCR